jgi:hypothetical protein
MSEKLKLFRQYASDYLDRESKRVEAKLSSCGNRDSKLYYLILEKDSIDKEIDATSKVKSTEIKLKINAAYNILGAIDDYIEKKECEGDMKSIVDGWKTKNEPSITTSKRKGTKTFIEENKHLMAYELEESFRIINTRKIENVPAECVAGICYGMIEFSEHLESLIKDGLYGDSLSPEEIETYIKECTYKIVWADGLDSFARLFNMLYSVEIIPDKTKSMLKRAKETIPHFHFPKKGSIKPSNRRSLQNAFDNTKDVWNELKVFRELLK